MSKRYGRNQRRKARTYIADLENRLSEICTKYEMEKERHIKTNTYLKRDIAALRMGAEAAQEKAFANFVERQGLYERYVELIGAEIGRAVGVELKAAAELLLHAKRSNPMLRLDISEKGCCREKVHVIQGCIPEFRYSIAV